MMYLDADLAARLADIALGHVRQEYPHKLDHVLLRDEDAMQPHVLHPIFYGSFDWHSCVHGWWTLLTLRRLFPQMPAAAAIRALADDSFTADKAQAELDYLARPLSSGFERPYGWAWLMALHLEASRHEDASWGDMLEPLAKAFAERLGRYLALLTYPIRAGTHFNTAFALVLAGEWAARFDLAVQGQIRERARHWFGEDRQCQAWEPSGDDFLSPALIEALCMMRTMPPGEFAPWLHAFLPELSRCRPGTLFQPATVSDRSDGKIAHLDGLNLSRAWCWKQLSQALSGGERSLVDRTADDHLGAAMPHLSGDYAGEHWLATFALLALHSQSAASGSFALGEEQQG
jgi:hypothetical protein